MGFSRHGQIYRNGGEQLTGSLSSVESDRPCTSTKPEPVERGACSELRASYVCNMQWPGHNRSSARAFAVNPSRLPARPFGLRGLTAKARPSKGVCRAINAELRLHEPGASGNRSVWRTLCLTTRAPYKDGTIYRAAYCSQPSYRSHIPPWNQ